MRYFTFLKPKSDTSESEYITVSESDIRKEYYPNWYKKMCDDYEQAYVDQHYSFEDCLEYWTLEHGAWLVE